MRQAGRGVHCAQITLADRRPVPGVAHGNVPRAAASAEDTAQQQENNEPYQEYHKEYLRDGDEKAKADDCRNNREDKKNDCPVKHVTTSQSPDSAGQ